MKKLLLLAAVAVSAMTANAQAFQPVAKTQVKAQQALVAKQQTMAAVAGPKKNVAEGVYYTRPAGSYSFAFGKDGMGFYPAYVAVAPYTDFELVNQCTNKANSDWNWRGSDCSDYINADGNFAWQQEGAAGYYMPTIQGGRTEYTWGEENSYGALETYWSAMRCVTEVSPLSQTDPHLGPDYIGWGFLSSHFLFGDGQLENGGKLYQCFAVEQSFPKPMAPLYVEDIFVSLVNLDNEVFLPAGKELTLDIMNEEGEVLYSLTCGAEDITVEDRDPYETNYGDMRFADAVFTMKDVDPLTGDVAAVPFVLDEAFTVVISGFEGTGIGMRGHFMLDDDDVETAERAVVENGYLDFYNVADEGDMVSFTFQNPIAIPMTFTAMFDAAKVWETAYLSDGTELADFNVLKVSADGQTVKNAGYPDETFAYVNTAASWIDEDDTEMYYLADCDDEFPEWLTYSIDNSMWNDLESEDFQPVVYVTVEAEALPAGVEGRGCKLYVNGRGITSDAAIYVLQGNFTKEQADAQESTGVNSVLAPKAHNGKTYNVAGQQVSKNFKGIVVKDGKKFINK